MRIHYLLLFFFLFLFHTISSCELSSPGDNKFLWIKTSWMLSDLLVNEKEIRKRSPEKNWNSYLFFYFFAEGYAPTTLYCEVSGTATESQVSAPAHTWRFYQNDKSITVHWKKLSITAPAVWVIITEILIDKLEMRKIVKNLFVAITCFAFLYPKFMKHSAKNEGLIIITSRSDSLHVHVLKTLADSPRTNGPSDHFVPFLGTKGRLQYSSFQNVSYSKTVTFLKILSSLFLLPCTVIPKSEPETKIY